MDRNISYTVTFSDFRVLQGHMARRLYARNGGAYAVALLSVAICAVFIALAIVVNLHAYRTAGFLGARYPISAYLAIILCLVAAILALVPAMRLRLQMPRMQVSDDGPLLGKTTLSIGDDGLAVDRTFVFSKYRWEAIQGVEIVKGALIMPVDNGIGLVVPASAFSSEAARFELAAAISAHIARTRS